MVYYAHSDQAKDEIYWHLLKDHLHDTGLWAAEFAQSFGAGQMAYLAGLLHDLGKYAPEFQKRLQGAGVKVDHSTPGAAESAKRYGSVGILLAYIIAGHHCGLPDWGSGQDEASLAARLNKKLTDYSGFEQEINLPTQQNDVFPALKPLTGMGFSAQFLVRMVYSCLVDADFLDTEKALSAEKSIMRDNRYQLKELAGKSDYYLDQLCSQATDTAVNKKRAEILFNCREKALYKPGLFTLTVPTGGGKTLSSLSFALGHALRHGQQRIIYVIPYTSIIEQNARVFKSILGEHNVLEHHSNFTYPRSSAMEAESEYMAETAQKLQLATENWDMPVIATTNIQFFESLFAARSSKCRKLHHVANSVVIIDEAQMLPTGFLKPCLNALAELVVNYNTTVVLCTATQPAINKFLPQELQPVEIINNPIGLYQSFKRVQVQNIGDISDDELAQKIDDHHQVLCIVNSKKHARLLYEKINARGLYHLSTRMCPAHRTKVLEMIKDRLKNKLPCRVISTQLIEAGVDIDFPFVYRSMAGIDSIAQSAGRCNREGLLDLGRVYVFRPERHGLPKGWLSRTAAIGGLIFDRHDDPLSLAGVDDYFSALYDIDATELDKRSILADIKEQERQLRFPFRTIAEKFKLIDDNTTTVIIPWDDQCKQILEAARLGPYPGIYARKLQKYGVGVYEDEFKELLGAKALELCADRFYVLKEHIYQDHYSTKLGLKPFTASMFLRDTLVF